MIALVKYIITHQFIWYVSLLSQKVKSLVKISKVFLSLSNRIMKIYFPVQYSCIFQYFL